MSKNSNRVYALYHGDRFVDIDTVANLAKKRGVSENTIVYYSRPIHMKRTEGRGFVSVRLDD